MQLECQIDGTINDPIAIEVQGDGQVGAVSQQALRAVAANDDMANAAWIGQAEVGLYRNRRPNRRGWQDGSTCAGKPTEWCIERR